MKVSPDDYMNIRGGSVHPPPPGQSETPVASPRARANESDSVPPACEHHGTDVAGRERSPLRRDNAAAKTEDDSEEMKVELCSDDEEEGPMASVEQTLATSHQDQEPKGRVETVGGGEAPRSDEFAALMHEVEDEVDKRENASGINLPQGTAQSTVAAQPMSPGQHPSTAVSSRAPMSPPSSSQRTPSQRHQAVGGHEAASGRANQRRPTTAVAAFSRVPTPSSRPACRSRAAQGGNVQEGRNAPSAGIQLQQQPDLATAPAPNSASSPPSENEENAQPPPTLEATLVDDATVYVATCVSNVERNESTLVTANNRPEDTRITNVERANDSWWKQYKNYILVGSGMLVIGALVSAVVMLAGRGSDGAGGDQQTLLTTPATPPPVFMSSARPTPQLGMSPIGSEPLSSMPSKDPSLSIESSVAGGDQSSTSSDPSGVPSPSPSASPTQKPAALPPNQKPTLSPSVPTLWPSLRPSIRPTDGPAPSTAAPTQKPTALPINQKPTLSPLVPTSRPSLRPSIRPTDGPVPSTAAPTQKPTPLPTTQKPTVSPLVRTPRPSFRPSVRPTEHPVPVTVPSGPKPSLSPMTELQSSALELTPEEKIVSHFSRENVAIHDNTAVVGAPKNDGGRGSAFVYVKDNNGKWTQQAKLVLPDGASGDQVPIGIGQTFIHPYGADAHECCHSVGIYGDTVVIGIYGDNGTGRAGGSAHVFVRDGVTWTHLAKLVAPDGALHHYYFGSSVGIYDNTLIVGAYLDDNNGDRSGSVHLFTRNGNAWTHQEKLVAPDGATGDFFGASVGIFGDTIVIGAYGDDDNGSSSGSAFLFDRKSGAWTYRAKLLAPDGAANDRFGASVAIFGDTVVIGVFRDDDKGTDSGSAYLFARINDTWTYRAKLVAPDRAAYDYFGRSVAIHGDVVIVGSYRDDDIGEDSGSVHAFVRNGAAWTHHAKLLAPRTGKGFGTSVGIVDGTIISGSESGEAYVFSG